MTATRSTRLRVIRLVPELDFGGVESRVALQAEHIDRERFDFRVCAFHKPGAAAERIREAGIPVDVLGCAPSIRNPRTTWRVYRYLRRQRPDVLHASVGEGNFHGAIAAWLARVPNRIVEEVGVTQAHPITRRMLRFAYRRAHALIGVSQIVCDHVGSMLKLDRRRVHCIYNPVNPRFLEPIERVPRDPQQPLRLLAVGRLVPDKNHVFLLDVMEKLRERGVPARLRIAGEGPLRGLLEAEIAARGLSHEVELLGYRSDVPHLLAAADLFLFPSVAGEGQPNAIIEAAAVGVPVLASDIPVNHELHVPTAPFDAAVWAEQAAERSAAVVPSSIEHGHVQDLPSYIAALCRMYGARNGS